MGPNCIVIRAAGPHFCVGGDLVAMMASDHPASYITRLAAARTRRPGRAGAASTHPRCDPGFRGRRRRGPLRPPETSPLAASESTFTSAYTRLGISLDRGVTRSLPERSVSHTPSTSSCRCLRPGRAAPGRGAPAAPHSRDRDAASRGVAAGDRPGTSSPRAQDHGDLRQGRRRRAAGAGPPVAHPRWCVMTALRERRWMTTC